MNQLSHDNTKRQSGRNGLISCCYYCNRGQLHDGFTIDVNHTHIHVCDHTHTHPPPRPHSEAERRPFLGLHGPSWYRGRERKCDLTSGMCSIRLLSVVVCDLSVCVCVCVCVHVNLNQGSFRAFQRFPQKMGTSLLSLFNSLQKWAQWESHNSDDSDHPSTVISSIVLWNNRKCNRVQQSKQSFQMEFPEVKSNGLCDLMSINLEVLDTKKVENH